MAGLQRSLSRSLSVLLLVGLAVGCKRREEGSVTAQGKALYLSACSRCHGATGSGGVPAYEGGPSPRDFHDHDFHLGRTDEQLKQTIKSGKGAGMPAFGATFDDQQLEALVQTIRAFDSGKKP
jgi:mono/diheme cytochrome c family protein